MYIFISMAATPVLHLTFTLQTSRLSLFFTFHIHHLLTPVHMPSPSLFLLLITWPLRHCLLVVGSDRQSAFWRSSARRPLACKVDSSDLRGKEGVKGAVSRLLEAVTDECSECWQPVCQSSMSSNKKKIQRWAQLSDETDHVLII